MQGLFPDHDEAQGVAGYVTVAVERGVDVSADGLTYAVPPKLASLAVGQRVAVPLGRGNKPAVGLVTGRTAAPPQGIEPSKIKTVLDVQGDVSLTPDLVELAQWVSRYYVCPLGMTVAALLPASVKKGTGLSTRVQVRPAWPLPDPLPKLTALQQQILDRARLENDWLDERRLADLAGAKTTGPVRRMVELAVLQTRKHSAVRSDLDLRAQTQAKALTQAPTLHPDQQNAVTQITQRLDEFAPHVLFGVTGSGKTEVYLHAIEAMRERDPQRGAVVLVPEIALTPQTVGRFLARFDRVAVLHSGLTAAQRHAQWRLIRAGQADVIIGARSAVFAPHPKLGLIIVDEEHDSSYKQDQLPRYHARDVAVRRGQQLNIPVILGSATPSLESFANTQPRGEASSKPEQAARAPYGLIRMPERVGGARLPKVELIDLAEERRQRRGWHLLSQRLEQSLTSAFDAGHKALLMLNRRGYASVILCPDHNCGWTMTCDHCDAAMVYHKGKALPSGGIVRCHHCGAEQVLPKDCPVCGKKVTLFGIGTQRVEEELGRKFPETPVFRMDADTMRRASDYRETLDAFAASGPAILLGTQMIAKGLDFHDVTVVGLVNADTALSLPDFRAGERTYQLVSQVAGRAGRGEHPGRVLVQSFNPGDPCMQDACQHDYEAFAERELMLRSRLELPPSGRMVRVVCRDLEPLKANQRASELAANLVAEVQRQDLASRVRVRGPAPCPVARLADHYRVQVELLSDQAGPLQRVMTELRRRGQLISDSHTAIDVDPQALM